MVDRNLERLRYGASQVRLSRKNAAGLPSDGSRKGLSSSLAPKSNEVASTLTSFVNEASGVQTGVLRAALYWISSHTVVPTCASVAKTKFDPAADTTRKGQAAEDVSRNRQEISHVP